MVRQLGKMYGDSDDVREIVFKLLNESKRLINMTAALDTDGHLYLSLIQQNTDSDVVLMFMSWLALILTQEDKDWR